METIDDEKLILNEELFYFVRSYIRNKKSSAEIITKIEELLNGGADINACDKNDNNNTILHIAVQKEEKDIVIYLIQKGIHLFSMQDKQRAIKLALQKNTTLGKEIAEILTKLEISPIKSADEASSNQQQKIMSVESINNENETIETNAVNDVLYTYAKRAGTSGVSGQFYETKLLSLVLHRALHDKDIKEFYLAANIKDIGDFDDLCFRYENVACFMQTKHRENTDKAKLTVASVRSSTGKLGLGIYFDSFLRIKRKFSLSTNDPMFQGKFEEIDSYFILYTPLKESFDRKLSNNKPICNKLHDIIFTGENQLIGNIKCTDLFQFDFEDSDLDFLTKFIKHDHMKILAKTFLEFILSNNKLEAMMASELVKIYHPALAQKVLLVSKGVPVTVKGTNNLKTQNIAQCSNSSQIHIGKFRDEFFDSTNFQLMQLKDTFYREIVYTHSGKFKLSKEELNQKLQDIANCTCAETISQLIGCSLKFDDTSDKLSLDMYKIPKNLLKQDEIQKIMFCLQNIHVSKTMIRDAIYIAGKKKMQTLTFQLPESFGNIDLTTNKKKGKDRLDFLAKKFQKLIEYFTESNKHRETKIIELNTDVVGPGKILEFSHLDSNGIGGAVGNLLEFDVRSELFNFSTKVDLPDNAQYVLNKIKELVKVDLSKYKIKVMLDGFPRTTFNIYQYDKDIASQFFSKLWFFTNQAQEELVETKIKQEISIHHNVDKQRHQFLFHVHSDAIFLRFHDKMQKWWKRSTDAQYLTKNTTVYEEAKKDIVDSPLLTVLSVMFIRKIKELGIKFDSYEICNVWLNEFNKCGRNKVLSISSDAVILSAAKIMQCNESQNNFVYINLDYVHLLPQNDYKTLLEELQILKYMTLVIVSETPLDEYLLNTLHNILNTFTTQLVPLDKQNIIIITGELISVNFESYNFDNFAVKDDHVSLIDLSLQSQKHILDSCFVIYQGQKVHLNNIIEDDSMHLINAKLLWSLMSKEKIEIGKTIEHSKYNEIKQYYIDRDLECNGDNYLVKTLRDLDDKVVLISSKPLMGKTVLLTHLSIETKKVEPKLWIVRIDLASYAKDLELIQNKNTETIMTFLTKAVLNNPNEIENVKLIEINNETIAIDGDEAESISFEFQLFIRLYNSDNVIFLFDGFEKVFPQYTNEALELFTALECANKCIWITSDCYAINVLRQRFGSPYELPRLKTIQQYNFLERFWSANCQLEKLNYEQFNNLILFIEYIFKSFSSKIDIMEVFDARNKLPFLSVSLHLLYLTLLDHFTYESDSVSPHYFREKLKRELSLDSYTGIDRYLQSCSENESLELTGTPFHLYIAANYFVFQITDRFDLQLNNKMIIERSNVYMNAVTLYEQFLKVNMKEICEIENKTAVGDHQENMREEFFENHKKLALYAIYKEKDISKILSPSEIIEVKKTINMIESGEMKSDLIDCVIDGVPRFYHLLFAEYFIVETLADLLDHLKRDDCYNIKLQSFWDFLVNVFLVTGPPGLRRAFEYKLKYNPELADVASNDYCNKIVFELLSKPKTEDASHSATNALSIAMNEGLTCITNFLMRCIRSNVNTDKIDKVMTIIKSGANIVDVLDSSRSFVSEEVIKCFQNPNGETIIRALNLNQVGHELSDTIKEKYVEPIQRLTQKIVEVSEHNENIVAIFNELPNHLPDCFREMFNKN